MRIDVMSMAVGVGAGAVDTLAEWQDERTGRTAFLNWTNGSRIGLALLAYLGQWAGWAPKALPPLAQSEITLVTKSVGDAIRKRAGVTAPVSRATRRTPGGIRVPLTAVGGEEAGILISST